MVGSATRALRLTANLGLVAGIVAGIVVALPLAAATAVAVATPVAAVRAAVRVLNGSDHRPTPARRTASRTLRRLPAPSC